MLCLASQSVSRAWVAHRLRNGKKSVLSGAFRLVNKQTVLNDREGSQERGKEESGGEPGGSTYTNSSIGDQAEARGWTQAARPLLRVFTGVLAARHGTRPGV